MRTTHSPALVWLAVTLTLGALACGDQAAPTAPPAAEPRSLTALEPGALGFAPEDLTVPNTWATKSPIQKGGAGIQAGTLNGIIYVVGADGKSVGSSLRAYHVATDAWFGTRHPLPSAQVGVNGVSPLNGRLYVTGGRSTYGGPTNTVYMYNPATNTWARKANLPVSGACGAQGVIGRHLYVYLACTPKFLGHSFWRYDPATNRWVIRRQPPTVHGYPATGVIGGKFYLAGGTTPTGDPNLTLNVYNPATNSWVTRASPPAELRGTASGVLKGKLHVAGGGGKRFPHSDAESL